MKLSGNGRSSATAVEATGKSTHLRFHFQQVYVSTRPAPGTGLPHWIPAIDMYETEDEVVLEVDLAGVPGEDMQVQFTARSVQLSGLRRERAEASVQIFHVMEIERGQFTRTIELPALIEPDTVRASYSDGLLVLRVCKRHASLRGCRKARNREGLD
jgi:HSP20 family protein